MDSLEPRIEILIVGAGLAGLFCALGCKRQGFASVVLESKEMVQSVGDFITIGPAAVRAFKKWPTLYDAFHKAAYDTKFYYNKQHGELGAGPRKVNESFGSNIIRPDLHKMLLDTVLDNGVEVRYLQHVVEYSEIPDKGEVKLSNGEILYADLVIAADGIRLKSWTVPSYQRRITNIQQRECDLSLRLSYIACHEIPSLRKNWDASTYGETMHFFLGFVSHNIMLIGKEKICWGLMHRDDATTSS